MSSVCRRLSLIASVAIALSITSRISWGQSSTGTVLGAVLDPSNSVVPGAQIHLTNVATNQRNRTSSNGSGYFEFPFVSPGKYRLEVSAAGFKTFVRDELEIFVNQRAGVDVRLELGTAAERVTVASTAPLLDTEGSSLGGIVAGRQLVDLPLNARQVFGLAMLTEGVSPGAVGIGPGNEFNTAINFSIDGTPRQSAKVLIDGVDATVNPNNPAFQGVAAIPSVDAVQEFKIQSNNFSAEFGRANGGVVNVVLKSGTNAYHGSLYEFLRNSKMDANDFFANARGTPLASFKRNQFGGSVGGPVVVPRVYNGKNHTFFFFSREALRARSESNTNARVPTDLERSGDFSQTFTASGALIRVFDPASLSRNADGSYQRQVFVGNQIPTSRINTIARNILPYYPLPNNPGSGPAHQGNYFVTSGAVSEFDHYDGKLDQNVGSGDRFSLKVSRYGSLAVPPGVLQSGATQTVGTYTAGVEYTHIARPDLIVNLAVGVARLTNPRSTIPDNFLVSTLGLPSAIDGIAQHHTVPRIAPSDVAAIGPTADIPLSSASTVYQFRGSINAIRGRQSIKAGGEWQIRQVGHSQGGTSGVYNFDRTFTQGPNPLVPSNTAGFGFAGLLSGIPSGGQLPLVPFVSTQNHNWALFMQDDIRVTKKFTLNLGVRWEVELPRTERYNQQNYWDLNITNPLAASVNLPLKGGLRFVGVNGNPRSPYDAIWTNLGPRVGFAYSTAHGFVLRGGYGVFYGISPVGAAGLSGGNVLGYSASTPIVGTIDGVTPVATLNNPFPSGFVQPTGNSLGLATGIGQDVSSVLRDAKTAYTEQWNFNIQHIIPGNVLVEAAYAGSRGLNLIHGSNANQLPGQYLALGSKLQGLVNNPFYGYVSTGTLAASQVQLSQLLRPFPQFTGVSFAQQPGGQSTYHSFQLRGERRFAAGFSFLATFTGSKLLTNSDGNSIQGPVAPYQDYEHLKLERSLASFDVPRRLSLSFIYELPWGRGKHWGSAWPAICQGVLGGWQISGIGTYQSGLPVVLSAANVSQANAGTERPNSLGRSARLSSSRSTDAKLAKWFDTAAFAQPANFTFGNVGRVLPDVRFGGQRNWDLAALKNFPLHGERLKLQARAEFFNAFNMVCLGRPDSALNSATFGTVNSQSNSPRQLQFGLRLVF